MAKQKRRRFTGHKKIGILKRHLVDKTKVSDLCDEHNIQPTQFYAWQKQLFENGAVVFEKNKKTSTISASEAKIKRLEATLVRRNAMLAELLDGGLNAMWPNRNTGKG